MFLRSAPSQAPPAPPSVPAFQPVRPLPALRFQVERVNVEHTVPMYGPELVGLVSALSQPSDNLLHHCYVHCYLKVRGALRPLQAPCRLTVLLACFARHVKAKCRCDLDAKIPIPLYSSLIVRDLNCIWRIIYHDDYYVLK